MIVICRVFSSIDDFPTNYSCKIFDDPFSIQELTSAIRNLKIYTSPRLDKIDNRMLSLLPEEYFSLLLDIFNSIFDSFPATWRHSLIFLIPKSSPDKFRPISPVSLKFLKELSYIALDDGWSPPSFSVWISQESLMP